MNDWTLAPLRDHPHLIPALAPLHQAQWAGAHPDMDVAAWEREFHGHALFGLPLTLVAIDREGQLLGSASLIMDDMEQQAPYAPWLANVLVLPAARGRGIGAALISAIADRARAIGHVQLYLFTTDQQDFYTQRGWMPFEERLHHGKVVTLMRRSLA